MELIDSHCHLDVEAFDPDREQVLQRSRQAGVSAFVIPGIHAAGWQRLLDLCRAEKDCHPALGLHPVYLERHSPKNLAELEQRLIRQRPLAVGEIGLDYFLRDLDRADVDRAVREMIGDPRYVRTVADHLAAMTDTYAIEEHGRLLEAGAVPLPSVEQLRREDDR